MISHTAMRLAKIVLVLFACSLYGCAGLGVAWYGDDTTNVSDPGLSAWKGSLRTSTSTSPKLTKSDLLQSWGPADRIDDLGNGKESWLYNFDLRWNGLLLLIVVVPVPIMVPVGYERVEFTIQDTLVKAVKTTEYNSLASYGCVFFFFSSHVGPGGCDFGIDRDRPSRFWGMLRAASR